MAYTWCSGEMVCVETGSTWDRRQSLAFFYNVNKDALIQCLTDETPKYEAVVAGDFLMSKHLASIQHAQQKEADVE